MPKPELEFFDPEATIPWTPVPGVAGLERLTLSQDPDTGDYTGLQRFAPGTDTSPLRIGAR